MNYDIALQLKNAGFPQNGKGLFMADGTDIKKSLHEFEPGNIIELTSYQGDVLYLPTLSELIDACGKKFDNLEKSTNQHAKWRARAWVGTMPIIEFGDTMEEAVAKLWLELNK